MGGWYEQKHYSDWDDDDEYNGSSTTDASASTTTPPPDTDEIIALTILYSFSNGDVLIAMEETTTRICSPSPLPDAQTTVHKEHDPSTSTIDLSQYGVSGSSSSTKYDASGYPESQNPYSTTSMGSSKPFGFASSTTSSMPSNEAQSMTPGPDPDEPHHHPPIGIMVAIPLVILGILIAGFFAWRRKRQQRRERAGISQEMKMRSPDEGLPRYSAAIPPPPAPLLSPARTGPTTTTSSLTPQSTSMAPSTTGATAASDPNHPVILNNNMGGAYFTGIDTSDALSITSGAQNSRMSLDARSMISSDDPPPPYRPRSVPPISRETSLRQPNTVGTTTIPLAPLSESNLSNIRLHDGLSNPFADPDSEDDDEFASQASTPINSPLVGRREEDHNSTGYPSLPSRT